MKNRTLIVLLVAHLCSGMALTCAASDIQVMLSDGRDTASSGNLDSAIRAAKRAQSPVYVVALKGSESDPKALATIASATGGRLTKASQSGSLGEIFGALASELQSGYEVTFESRKPNTPDLEVRIEVEAQGASPRPGKSSGSPASRRLRRGPASASLKCPSGGGTGSRSGR